MKTNLKFTILLLIAVSIIITSCTVENRGPVGPAGENGYANIKILTFDIPYNSWGRKTEELNKWYYRFNSDLIDYYVIDHGAVLYYYGFIEYDNNVNQWYSIPFTDIYYDVATGRNYEKIYDATYQFQTIEIDVTDKNVKRYDLPFSENIRVKVVILETNQYNALKYNNVDVKDYKSVANELRLNSSK